MDQSNERRKVYVVALEMQGDGKYIMAKDDVFDVVAEYLEGESIAYQQEVATQILKHPMLVTPEWDILSFWHPDLQEYFAARGLQDAVLRQGSVESVLRYLGVGEFHKWYDILVYLAGLLGQREVTKLIDYLLDFNHQLRLADTIVHRDAILQVLVERFCSYFVAVAELTI